MSDTIMSTEEMQVIDLTNQVRSQYGLPPLVPNAQLAVAADVHNTNMISQDFFDHTGQDGSQPSDRAQAAGYEWSFVGENIGAGYTTPEDAVNGWVNSPGHFANITNPDYTEIGVGYQYVADDPGTISYNHYWTQVFGKSSANPQPPDNQPPNNNATEDNDLINLSVGQFNNSLLNTLGGNDTVNGSADAEQMNGNQGLDSLLGNGGVDVLNGGKDNDLLDGGEGDDILAGDRNNDTLSGQAGNDLIKGGKDNDLLEGGIGNDTLSGDLGSDTLTGGDGNDIFMLRNHGLGTDLITDFLAGSDVLQLPDEFNFDDLQISSQAGNSIISLNGEDLAVISDVINISSDDFVGGSPSPTPDPNSDNWLDRVNYFRSLANLSPVTNNDAWTQGAIEHSKYIVKEDQMGHEEDPNSPWSTPAGIVAGQAGNVAAWSIPDKTDVEFIDTWMFGPFHGLGIIDPQLTQVAYGAYREADDIVNEFEAAATLDVNRGIDYNSSPQYPVMWPADGKTVSFKELPAGESPDPISGLGYTDYPAGLPIYLQIGAGDITPNVTAHSLTLDNTPIELIWYL